MLLLCTPAAAQGIFDPTFTQTMLKDRVYTSSFPVRAMLQQADGKILVGGSYGFVDNQRTSCVRRLNPDGTPDVAFTAQTGGGSDAKGNIAALALQSTGKILLGCAENRSYGGVVTGNLVRLNPTGSVDDTFNVGGDGFTYYEDGTFSRPPNYSNNIRSLAVQPDDKILVGGNLDHYNRLPVANLLRLNSDGTPDASFNVGSLGFTAATTTTPNSGTPEVILVQPDGKIVVGGNFARVNGTVASNLVRLNADGTRDITFLSTGTNAPVRTLVRQPDGKLLVGGFFTQLNGQASGGLVRLNADGTRDASFATGVLSPTAAATGVYKIRLRADGTVVVCGTFSTYNGTVRGGIAKVSSTGVLDASFGPAVATTNAPNLPNVVYEVFEIANGQTLAGGVFGTIGGMSRTGLARLNNTASQVDAAYNPVTEFSGFIARATPLNDGNIVIEEGNYNSINGTPVVDGGNAQLLSNTGTFLRSISLSAAPYTFDIVLPYAQPDGRFLAWGYNVGSTFSGATMLRLLASGTLDTSFTPVTFTYPSGYSLPYFPELTTLPNGDMLLFGDFTALNGQARPGLGRVSGTGALNTVFNPTNAPWQVAPSGGAYLAGVQPNGQPLIGWHDNNNSYLIRLSATTGALDNSFSIGSGASNFRALLQANGQAIITGFFTSFNGQASPNGLLRLLLNGQPDPSFNAAIPLSIGGVQPDGHLLGVEIPGPPPFGMPAPIVRIRRLNANGSLDTTFPTLQIPQGRAGRDLVGSAIQPQDGKLLVFGGITSINGQMCGQLVRISNTLLATRPAFAAAPELDVFPNPAQQQVTLRLPSTAVSSTAQPVALLDMQGRTVRRFTLPARQAEATFSLTDVAAGVYLLQASTSQGTARQRVAVTH